MEVVHEKQDLELKPGLGVHCSAAVKTEPTSSPNFEVKNENPEIWLAQGGDGDDVADADPSSLFYSSDEFPPLPEFPCMSSSSSTSSTPATNAGISTSGATSSSSSSYDYENRHPNLQQQQHHHDRRFDDDDRGVDDCMNVMEDFDCIGINQLIEDSNEIWDPTPLFEEDQSQIPQTQTNLNDAVDPFSYPLDDQELICPSELQQQQQHADAEDDHPFMFLDPDNHPCSGALSEDLAVVFFEWLKSNKESISAEELRSIKIKKSTIESAAKRLGGGKEGMKQLLKLILEWVQNHRLQSKRAAAAAAFDFPHNPNPTLMVNPCFTQQQPQQQCWMPPPYVPDPAPSSFTSMVSYIGHDPYATVPQPYHAPDPYHHQQNMMNDGSSWAGQQQLLPQFPLHYNTAGPPGPVPGNDGSMMAPQAAGYGSGYNPYQFFPGDIGLVRMGSTTTTSATKEARKKRMARQRRLFSHHHHRAAHNNPNHHHQQQQQQMMMIQGAAAADANCLDPNARPAMDDGAAHGGWLYWPTTTPGGACSGGPIPPGQHLMQQQQPVISDRNGTAVTQAAGSQRQATTSASDKKQGFRAEKNLKFLLQKVLKQSDVGNLGRIVLPKKEAETHLPELDARDGIPIAMEDIGTSRVWNMRYRFWPNNKSRMYLLENTGDFVRSNGLQEGDFIVIYSDVKCGKYMIRGVKVRPQHQQGGSAKAELAAKKQSKAQKTHNSASPAGGAVAAFSPFAYRQ